MVATVLRDSKMNKLCLFTVICSFYLHGLADETKYSNFQQFDNQVSFGMSANDGMYSANGVLGRNNKFDITSVNLEVEKLFAMGLWSDINIGNIQSYVEPDTRVAPLGPYPFLATLNGKFGYNFPLLDNKVAAIPYVLVGKNANITQFNVIMNSMSDQAQNISKDFYWTAGLGGRFEYLVNKYVSVYFDQMYAKNWDQAGLNMSNPNIASGDDIIRIQTSNWQLTSTLGIKVNPWENLILSVDGFYTSYHGYGDVSLNYLNSQNAMTGVPTMQRGILLAGGFSFK